MKSTLVLWDRLKICHKKSPRKSWGKNIELSGLQLTLAMGRNINHYVN